MNYPDYNNPKKAAFPWETEMGVTKREHFALKAMHALIINRTHWSNEEISKASVKLADALIEALNK